MFDLQSLGLNLALLASIIGASEVIKKFDSGNVLKRFYVLLPAVLSGIAGFFITKPFAWQDWGYNSFVYFGISSLAYNVIKKTFMNKMNELNK